MRYVAALALLCATLVGCSAPGPVAVLSSTAPVGHTPNLVLAPSADKLQDALRFAARSDWPGVEIGYRLGDVTYYTKETYDYQSGFDRFGGLYHAEQNVQTGMRLP